MEILFDQLVYLSTNDPLFDEQKHFNVASKQKVLQNLQL